MIIAVVGAGGKTTRIHKLAEQYRKLGKKVLVTTTTHMYLEDGCVLSGNVEEIIEKLNTCEYCMAGVEEENDRRKIKELPQNVYKEVCEYADVVLVEADGSKGMPVKFPADYEPVIPDNVTEIHIVMGLRGIGHPIKDVCHRIDQVLKCLKVTEDTLLTMEHLQRLVEEGYIKPLKKTYPKVPLKIFFNEYKHC